MLLHYLALICIWQTSFVSARRLHYYATSPHEPLVYVNVTKGVAETPNTVTGARQLQATTCTPSTAYGTWSGTPPDMSMCGNFYWTGAYGNTLTQSRANTWVLSCDNGFALFGSPYGTCTGVKSCYYNPNLGYQGSCSSVCTYTMNYASWTECIYCCVCSNSFSFSYGGGSCRQCVPPAASYAVNPTTTFGTSTYSWTCQKGYYGTPVTRTCLSTTDGAGNSQWSGSAIACYACPALGAPGNGYIVRDSTELDTWYQGCNPGFFSSTTPAEQTRVCSTTNGGYSGSQPTCSVCGAGYYCSGGLRTLCPAGRFGLPTATTLSSSTCSGTCIAGYFCGAGSTSSTQNACGSIDVYCPAGSGAPIPVSNNYYTTPTTAPANLRTGQLPCPADRACSGGVILPGIDISDSCPLGSATARVDEQTPNINFGPTFVVSTPGYSGALTWTITSIVRADATCGVSTSHISILSAPGTGNLRVGANVLDYPSCMNGFTVTWRVARSNDASISATCTVAVEILQVAKPPIITDCGFRSIAERSIAGTNVGAPLQATNLNIGTSLLWSIDYVTSGNIPLSIGMCDGQIRVLRPFLWRDAASYRLDLTVKNDGTALGIGSRSSTCRTYVNVTMMPLPPTPTVTAFFIPELSPVGTLVGNVFGQDPNNFTFNCTWGSRDTPDAFAISPGCNITALQVIDTLNTLKSIFTYKVNMTNGFAMSSTTVTITLLPMPRPPTISDQLRRIRDDARVITWLSPPLTATHRQNLTLTFALSTTTSPFNITNNGTLFLARANVLDFNIQNVYTLGVIVTDTNGQSSSASVTIEIEESNKPPTFVQPRFDFQVDEGSLVGSTLTGPQNVLATDPNTRDVPRYSIDSAVPDIGRSIFAIDPLTGVLTLGSGLAATNGRLVFDGTLGYLTPRTFRLNISVTDNGVPPMRANTTAWVTITNIRPRVAFTASDTGEYIIASNVTANTMLTNVSKLAWTAYDRTDLRFSISAERTALEDNTFTIDPLTGIIRVANVTYINPQNVTVWGAPRFDYNSKNVFVVNVTVMDLSTTLTATVSMRVFLSHINRPPAWLTVPRMFAKAKFSGSIGNPLLQFVNDPDASLSVVQETFTFTIVSGNVENTFAIIPSTGQIFVANNGTASFDLTSPTSVPVFNLTVMVKDAGINGPSYNATTVVHIEVTNSNLPPYIGFHNLTVDELVPVGTVVGYVQGYDQELVSRLTYFISPAGPNINQPFPFNISTVAGGVSNYNRGLVYVIDDGVIDWNNRFKVYQAFITVIDNDANTPLHGTGPLQINVNWVPRPPFFNPSRLPSSRTFTISVNEGSLPGTAVSTSGLLAASKDPWETPLLRYRWQNAGALANVFAVHPVTAMVTMAPGAPLLRFNDQNQYTLTLFVNDTRGANDTATVVINIIDVNDPAVFNGLGDDKNVTLPAGSALRVAENATVGTIFGYVRAYDVDRDPLWGQINFDLVPSADSSFFGINRQNGSLFVARTGLDFWDQTRFYLNVSVKDGHFNPITVYQGIWVDLIQVNTVTFTGFAVPPGVAPTVGVNVSDSVYAGQYNNVDTLITTRGINALWLYGTGFGRTARRLAAEGATAASTVVNATFGYVGTEFTAQCSVIVPNTVISCAVPAGVGVGHIWRITVDGWVAWSTRTTGYIPPSITSVIRVGANASVPLENLLSTRGIHSIEITGDNFGAVGSGFTCRYGQTIPTPDLIYLAPSCVVQHPGHTRAICTTMEGIGANLGFRVNVGAQNSPVFTSTHVRYEPPNIQTVSAPLLYTAGGEIDVIVINGTGFGPLNTQGIVVRYSKDETFNTTNSVIFTARRCYVASNLPHAQIICTSAPGIGANLRVMVTVGGQDSVVSAVSQTISYRVPIITQIGGLGARQASTEGGQQIIITGAEFGLVTPLDEFGFPLAGPLQPSARYGRYVEGQPLRYEAASCRVAVANSQILCLTAPGTGKDLVWQITVGDQDSAIYFNQMTSYSPPIIASYSGEGTANAFTWGGQVVRISGTNFGPMGTEIDYATYGADANGTEFQAWNCSLVVPHTIIDCFTDVGAGSGLSWYVTIDGQRSVSPSTAYGRPVIYNFTGSGAVDASTDGGDTVVITGSWFSVQKYLDGVTYGPSGMEHRADDCRLSANHTQITCITKPGTGRKVKWVVSVGGQSNELPDTFTSYASPRITAATPLNGATNGGTVVTITGTNFAANYSAAQVLVKINNLGTVPPSQQDIDDHWNALYNAQPGLPHVAQWINELTTVRPNTLTILSKSVHRLTFPIPEGYGPSCELFVLVDGVPSNITRFKYDAPRITNAAPDRQDVPLGFLRVFLDGTSFCSGRSGCGELRVNGELAEVRLWEHNKVMFVMADQAGGGANSLAVITVGGVPSNAFPFRRPVPNLSSQVTQLPWRNMDTNGGQTFQILGVLDIGLEPVGVFIGGAECVNVSRAVSNGKEPTDPNAEFTLSCVTPPGIGLNLPIVISSLGGSSREDNGFVFSYAAPIINDLSLGAAFASAPTRRLALPDGIPTLGMNLTITGSYFGTPTLLAEFGGEAYLTMDDSVSLPVLLHTQSAIHTAIPPGDGVNHWVRFVVGGQPSAPFFFRYSAPAISSVSPATGPTPGGTIITVRGSNFGVSRPNLTINGRPCLVSEPFVASPGHDTVNCTTPAGQDTSHPLRITVNTQQSSINMAAAFSYLPPTVDAVMPARGPTSGYSDVPTVSQMSFTPTQRIKQYIHGHNFGESGVVSFEPFEYADPLSEIITVMPDQIISWNHTTIVLYQPAGFGDFMRVVVSVGTQSSRDLSAVVFEYDPPVVFNITRHDRNFADCQPREQCYRFGNITACKMNPAGCYDTIGDFPLRVVGANFGPQSSLGLATFVTIGGRRCGRDDRYDQNHNILVCTVPRGLGDRNPVVVRVGSRESSVNEGSVFAYDPPNVVAIMPNTPDALGTQVVTFRGKNMGFEPTTLTIHIDALLCEEPEWVSDAQVRCRPPVDVVGPKSVSILVANRSEPFIFYDFEEMYISECKFGFYGVRNESCLKCMRGGVCPGGEQLFDLVVSQPGFWRENLTVPDQRCEAERWSREEHGCPFLSACEPSWSCIGNNECGEGYEGPRCMFCLKGKYYRVNGECIKCPQSLYAILIGMGGVLVAAAAFAYWMNKKKISIALVAIGVDYAQVLSMFAKTRIRWPAYLKEIFSILSAFNLNIELTAPECMVPEMQYWQKFTFIEMLPFSFLALFGIIFIVKLSYKWACLNKTKKELFAHLPTLVSTSIIIYRILYLYLTRTSMDVMNCAPTDPPDGHQYMSGMLDMPCWESGSMQVFLFPFALTFLSIYTVGIPFVLWWFMRRNKFAIITDQLLRAKGMGDDRISNPKFYEFRKTWSKLYYHFKPDNWYWEMCIFVRKAMLSFTSLMFRSTPSYQLALALLILFVAYVAHVRSAPYLTHSDKPKVIAEHLQRALSDNVHASIEAEMRAAEKKNTRKRTQANVFALRTNTKSFAQTAVLAVFDYNTVEGVLLASAVLTVLAGIMFDSNRFSVDNMLYYQAEYDSLTASVLTLIVATLVYYMFVFVMDMAIILCPNRSMGMLEKCAPKSSARKTKRHTTVAEEREGGTSDMVVNPFMLQHQMNAEGEEGDTGSGFQYNGSGIIDPNHVASINGLPNGTMWKAIQMSYGKLSSMLNDLQQQVRDAKRQAENNLNNSSGRMVNNVFRAGRNRRQFAPTMREAGVAGVDASSADVASSVPLGMSESETKQPSTMTPHAAADPTSIVADDVDMVFSRPKPTKKPVEASDRSQTAASLLATFNRSATGMRSPMSGTPGNGQFSRRLSLKSMRSQAANLPPKSSDEE